MYATCLFCSAPLGTNESLETFPVGSRVAFDAGRGRLWAVCARCGRWNLAPIEERWEAVEAAERLFADTRSRAHSENIGLARLRDGTRLVRVGSALPGELAAWRYGGELISRRRRNIAWGVASVGAAGAIIAGLPLIASAGVPIALLNIGVQVNLARQLYHQSERVVHRVSADRSPIGEPLVVRRRHLHEAVLTPAAHGGVGVRLPTPILMHAWKRPAFGWKPPVAEPLDVGGDDARRLLARSMIDYNSRGAKQQDLERALAAITAAGGPDAFARRLAGSGAAITRGRPGAGRSSSKAPSPRQILGTFRGEVMPIEKYRDPFDRDNRPKLDRIDALAFEMALQEEAERRALEGELAALEAAWREAEEIAQIADALPGEPGRPLPGEHGQPLGERGRQQA
jgi:hypothetical protein